MKTVNIRLACLQAAIFLCILLTQTGCSFQPYSGTLLKKEYHPAYVVTRNETQIIRGTLHENVPTEYAHSDWFIVYLSNTDTSSTAESYKIFTVKKSVYDTLIIGKVYTRSKSWRQLRNP